MTRNLFGKNPFALVLSVGLLISMCALQAEARGKKGSGQNGGSQTPSPQLSADQAALTAAQATLNTTTTDLQQQFQAAPAYTTALQNKNAAQQAYTFEQQRVLHTLSFNPDYTTALNKQTQAEKHVEDLRDQQAAPDDIAAAAQAALDAKSAVHVMESDALANDVKAVAAHNDLNAASKAFYAVVQTETATVQADPKWIAAKKAVDDAQAKVNADSANAN